MGTPACCADDPRSKNDKVKADSAKRKAPGSHKYPLLLAAEFLQLPFSTPGSAWKGQAAQVLVTHGISQQPWFPIAGLMVSDDLGGPAACG